MAIPPTIPTSFVPKQPVQTTSRIQKSGGNLFLVIAMFLLGVAVAGAAGVFLYERYLEGVAERKAQAVAEAQARVNPEAVEEFIRTRDRFTSAKNILDNHVAVSQFFDLLEATTLQTVRFNGLSFLLADDRSAQISMSGVARTFNALAAQSSAFASEKRIKSAIFSDIAVGQGGLVTFTLEADVDPRLIALSSASAPEVEEALPIEGAQETPANDASAAPLEEEEAAPADASAIPAL